MVVEEPQADLDLSEPEEWSDILGEFEELRGDVPPPLEAELEQAEREEAKLEQTDLEEAESEEAEPEQATPLAEEEGDEEEADPEDDSIDEPLDMDSQFALQAEAMGIDLSGMHESLATEEEIPVADDIDLDELLNESNRGNLEVEDLLDEELVEEFDNEELGDEPELEIEESDEAEQL